MSVNQVWIKELTFPAWRALTKTSTDALIVCRAKSGRAAKKQEKDKNGVPFFDFTVSEAESFFKYTRPTFTKAIRLLLEMGFIECLRPGGMIDGNGVKALYRLSDKWKSWEPPERDNSNMSKARLARKQNPSKGALNTLGKGALTSNGKNKPSLGKGALTSNPYFTV